MELTSRDIHYYSHPHQRSKSPICPWGIVLPIQQLGSSLFPMFLSSRAPLLKQRSTCAKGCDPININFLHCCQPNTQTWRPQQILNVNLTDVKFICLNTSNDKDLYVSYIKQISSGFNSWNGRNIIAQQNLDCSILPCDNIPPIPLWATQYLCNDSIDISRCL